MKKILIILLSITPLFFSCEEEKVALFNEGNRLFFEKFYMDEFSPGTEAASVNSTSFFFYPEGTQSIEVPITVLLSGKKLKEDKTFSLKVINKEDANLEREEEYTTATADEYELNEFYTFHANTVTSESLDIRDIINIKIKYSDRLNTNPDGFKLVVELVPNEDFGLGQFERRRAIIQFSKNPSKPLWWDDEVTEYLLGEYSVKKFKLFLSNIDTSAFVNAESIKKTPDKVKELVYAFKEWLANQETPITEDNGSLMTVNV